MKFKRIFLVIFLIFALIMLTGCGEKNKAEDVKAKAIEEINYLDSKIVAISELINSINLQNYKVETKEITNPQQEGQSGQNSQGGGSSSGGSSSGGQSSGGQQQQEGEGGNGASGQKNTITIAEMKTTSILANSNNEIDWNKVKSETELLYSTWDTIILDLHKLNIPAETINSFSAKLNETTINIKNEDKVKALTSLSELYAFLPKYLEYCSDTKETLNIKNTKQHILTAYSLVEEDNWDAVVTEVNAAIESYMPVTSNLGFIKGKEHAINRTYVILNELKNSLNSKDKDIFYINYKNLINELNLL